MWRFNRIKNSAKFIVHNKEARDLLALSVRSGQLLPYLHLLKVEPRLANLCGFYVDSKGRSIPVQSVFLTLWGLRCAKVTKESSRTAMEILWELKRLNRDVIGTTMYFENKESSGGDDFDVLRFAAFIFKFSENNEPKIQQLKKNLILWMDPNNDLKKEPSLWDKLKFWRRST